MKEKAWDEAMKIGERRVALEPENLDGVKLSLKAAESKGNQDDIAKWADCEWKMASQVAAKGGRSAGDAQQIITTEIADFLSDSEGEKSHPGRNRAADKPYL